MARILWIGFGDLAERTSPLLVARGHSVTGVKRQPSSIVAGTSLICADACVIGQLDELVNVNPDIVIFTLSPDERSEAGYRRSYIEATRNALNTLSLTARSTIVWVSSTSVYGQDDGQWVDETSETRPTSKTAQLLLEAEELVRRDAAAGTVIRFGGIYGGQSQRMIDKARQTTTLDVSETHYTNRIHRSDCAGFIDHLIGLRDKKEPLQECYIGVDNSPATSAEVILGLQDILGVEPAVEVGEGREKRYFGKRCRNLGLTESGYELRYPSWRQGYEVILQTS